MQTSSKRKAKSKKFSPFKSPALNPSNAMSFVPMNISHIPFPRRTGGKRPVDKIMINVSKSSVDATQVATTLVTATFPCTVVGLRWDFSCFIDGGTGPASFGWAIIILRDGFTQKTISLTDGSTFYAPEQDCIVFGRGINQQIDIGSGKHYNGSTKSMRKLMGGDKLMFICVGVATNTSSFAGVIQFFCKT